MYYVNIFFIAFKKKLWYELANITYHILCDRKIALGVFTTQPDRMNRRQKCKVILSEPLTSTLGKEPVKCSRRSILLKNLERWQQSTT